MINVWGFLNKNEMRDLGEHNHRITTERGVAMLEKATELMRNNFVIKAKIWGAEEPPYNLIVGRIKNIEKGMIEFERLTFSKLFPYDWLTHCTFLDSIEKMDHVLPREYEKYY